MERELALEMVRVTEAAALTSARWMGLGKKDEADGAAVDAMRRMFDTVQISGTVVYDRDISPTLGFQAAVNGRWQSDTAADLGDQETFEIDGYGLVNASVGVHALDDRWALQVWGRNITDTYYWTSVASNANVVVRFPGQAPTYGVSLTLNY